MQKKIKIFVLRNEIKSFALKINELKNENNKLKDVRLKMENQKIKIGTRRIGKKKKKKL